MTREDETVPEALGVLTLPEGDELGRLLADARTDEAPELDATELDTPELDAHVPEHVPME